MSTLLLTSHHHTSSLWPPIVSFLGITYFLAWSLSFYPQLLLNYRRKRTDGLSSDFVYLNPLGFLALSIWNFGMLYSPLARSQYANRHDGNIPQVAIADLAFSGHAFVLAAIALGQVWYYRKRTLTALEDDKLAIRGDGEREPLLSSERERGKKKDTIQDPAIPSLPCQIGLGIMFLFAIIIAILVKTGTYNLEYLDWLYAVSMIKLAVSAVKYAPQIIVNYKLKEVEGMAIEGIIAVSAFYWLCDQASADTL